MFHFLIPLFFNLRTIPKFSTSIIPHFRFFVNTLLIYFFKIFFSDLFFFFPAFHFVMTANAPNNKSEDNRQKHDKRTCQEKPKRNAEKNHYEKCYHDDIIPYQELNVNTSIERFTLLLPNGEFRIERLTNIVIKAFCLAIIRQRNNPGSAETIPGDISFSSVYNSLSRTKHIRHFIEPGRESEIVGSDKIRFLVMVITGNTLFSQIAGIMTGV